jgi:hypothetical protein
LFISSYQVSAINEIGYTAYEMYKIIFAYDKNKNKTCLTRCLGFALVLYPVLLADET